MSPAECACRPRGSRARRGARHPAGTTRKYARAPPPTLVVGISGAVKLVRVHDDLGDGVFAAKSRAPARWSPCRAPAPVSGHGRQQRGARRGRRSDRVHDHVLDSGERRSVVRRAHGDATWATRLGSGIRRGKAVGHQDVVVLLALVLDRAWLNDATDRERASKVVRDVLRREAEGRRAIRVIVWIAATMVATDAPTGATSFAPSALLLNEKIPNRTPSRSGRGW